MEQVIHDQLGWLVEVGASALAIDRFFREASWIELNPVLRDLAQRFKVSVFRTGEIFICAPACCDECMQGGDGEGHVACLAPPEDLRVLEELGFIYRHFDDGRYIWRIVPQPE